jgi:hypothetical protein
MIDGGNGGALNGKLLNNVVLRSSYAGVGFGRLKFAHENNGSAVPHTDDLAELFKNVDLHVICISENWFKRWHTNKHIRIPGYKVARSDRRDGRRSGGVAV